MSVDREQVNLSKMPERVYRFDSTQDSLVVIHYRSEFDQYTRCTKWAIDKNFNYGIGHLYSFDRHNFCSYSGYATVEEAIEEQIAGLENTILTAQKNLTRFKQMKTNIKEVQKEVDQRPERLKFEKNFGEFVRYNESFDWLDYPEYQMVRNLVQIKVGYLPQMPEMRKAIVDSIRELKLVPPQRKLVKVKGMELYLYYIGPNVQLSQERSNAYAFKDQAEIDEGINLYNKTFQKKHFEVIDKVYPELQMSEV